MVLSSTRVVSLQEDEALTTLEKLGRRKKFKVGTL